MRYITIAELSNMLRDSLWKIPHDIDLVVGIPRSGMMVANILALYLNKYLADIETFISGRVYSIGTSRGYMLHTSSIRKVLIVDDSVYTGTSILRAKEMLYLLNDKYNFIYYSPIVSSESLNLVDIYSEIIDDERIFEWNIFHHGLLEKACVDLDGILCLDPTIDDDGVQYTNYIQNATPLFIPTATIGTIVTCRLEKYRPQTVAWLKANNIKYKKLIMLDLPSKESRVKWNRHGEYKAHYFIESGSLFFIESSLHQAKKIAKTSHKDVFCLENNTLINIPQKNPADKIKKYLKKHHPKTFYTIKKAVYLITKN